MIELALLKEGVIVQRWKFINDQLTVGRHPHNKVMIDDEAVSGFHSRLSLEDLPGMESPQIVIEDLRSTNGTLVNGRPITKEILPPTALITISGHSFKLTNYPKDTKATVLLLPDSD